MSYLQQKNRNKHKVKKQETTTERSPEVGARTKRQRRKVIDEPEVEQLAPEVLIES